MKARGRYTNLIRKAVEKGSLDMYGSRRRRGGGGYLSAIKPYGSANIGCLAGFWSSLGHLQEISAILGSADLKMAYVYANSM